MSKKVCEGYEMVNKICTRPWFLPVNTGSADPIHHGGDGETAGERRETSLAEVVQSVCQGSRGTR